MNGGSPSYLGAPLPFSLETLLAVELVAMAGAESLRGSQEEAVKRKYPGKSFCFLHMSEFGRLRLEGYAFDENNTKQRLFFPLPQAAPSTP